MNFNSRKALIIQNTSFEIAVLSNFLTEIGFTPVKPVFSNFGLVEMIQGHSINLVLCDLHLFDDDGIYSGDGFEICRMIKNFCEDIKIILISPNGEDSAKDVAFNYGADECIEKPYSISYLEDCIRNLGFAV